MLRRRLNILDWPIGTKLAVAFMLTVLLPIIITVVPTISQRMSSLRQENRAHLEALGPYEVLRVEQTVQLLALDLERTFTNSTDYVTIQHYLSAVSTDQAVGEDTQRAMEDIMLRYLYASPSLSRVRLLSVDGKPLYDTASPETTLSRTPANWIVQSQRVRTRTSEVYLDAAGRPSVDVLFGYGEGSWETTAAINVIGYIAFTQDLALDDRRLPSLYGVVQNLPVSPHPTHVFLLNQDGQVILSTQEVELLQDASTSDGFRAARSGKTGVSTYYSPLLSTQVQGYYQMINVPDGPAFAVLIETPLENLNVEAFRDALLPLLPIALVGLLLGTVVALGTVLGISRPLVRLTNAARQMTAGRLKTDLPLLSRRDEIGVLNNTFRDTSSQLLAAVNELEDRVTAQTRDLRTTLEIGRILISIRELDTLLNEVVDLILNSFDKIYHAQVFLIDTRTNRAKLRASTGPVGHVLLQRGHYLDVGSQSVIGSVTASGHAVVALDTSRNPIHKRNEFLPDTRAEMALPLRAGDRIIGALDLQSKLPDAFTEQDVELFQGMADQITIAIENAMLFAESNARLREIDNLNRLLTRSAWQDVVRGQQEQALVAGDPMFTADHEWTPLQIEAMQRREIVEQVEEGVVTFAVPVLLRGEVLGAVEWQVPESRYTSDVRQTALELTTRLALTADNIRLFEQSRRAAQRESLVNQISSKLTGTTDINQILQTAVRELGLALRTPQTAIQLISPTVEPDSTDE